MAGKQMVTAKASKGGKKRHVSRIHITPSKNGGAAIETHFHPTKKAGDAADDVAAPYMAQQPESEMHTFTSPQKAGKHVQSMLETGYPAGGGDEDGDEAAPAEQ